MTTRTLAAAALVALAAAAPAQAATPETGTLDPYDTPKVEWTGETTGSVVQYAHFFYGEQLVDDCVAPICDAYTLTVEPEVGRTTAKVKISVEDNGYTEVQVRDAAGNEVFFSTGEDDAATVFTSNALKAGTYTVEVLTDALAPSPVDDPSYSAFATINNGVAVPRPE